MLRVTHLAGFGGSVKPLTLAQQASATSTSTSVTIPTVLAGDLIVVWNRSRSNVTIPTLVTPTGFTNFVNFAAAAAVRCAAHYKISDGTESGGSASGMNGGLDNDICLYTFRGTRVITAVSVQDIATEIQDGDPAAQTANASAGQAPLIVFGCYSSTGAVDPRTFTVGGSAAKDGEISASTDAYLAYKIYNSAPADVVIDMDDEGDRNGLASFYIQCTG
jgi:hypothetical protein